MQQMISVANNLGITDVAPELTAKSITVRMEGCESLVSGVPGHCWSNKYATTPTDTNTTRLDWAVLYTAHCAV